MNTSIIIGIVFSLVGGLLLAIGLFIWIRTRTFINSSQETKGTVIRMLYSSDSDGSGYAPVFKFTTITGQSVEVAEKVYSNPPQFREGQVIDVLYDPQNPNRARVKKWSTLYFVPLLLGGMGVVFGGVGVLLLIFELINMFA